MEHFSLLKVFCTGSILTCVISIIIKTSLRSDRHISQLSSETVGYIHVYLECIGQKHQRRRWYTEGQVSVAEETDELKARQLETIGRKGQLRVTPVAHCAFYRGSEQTVLVGIRVSYEIQTPIRKYKFLSCAGSLEDKEGYGSCSILQDGSICISDCKTEEGMRKRIKAYTLNASYMGF